MNQAKYTTLLIIEDDSIIRELYRQLLEMKGYRVIEAVDGNDGLQKFSKYQDEITLLIADVVLPCKNGKEMFDEIKKIKNDIRAIFTSGHNTELNRLLISEGHYYLQKPFAPQLLLDKISEVLS